MVGPVLGKPIRIYHPRLLGSGLGLGAVAIGAGMLWYLAKAVGDMPFGAVVIAVALSILALVLAITFARLTSLRVIAHEGGVAWTRAGHKQEVTFDDIKKIRELSSSVLIYRKGGGKPLDLPTTVIDRDHLLAHMNVSAASLPKATIRAR